MHPLTRLRPSRRSSIRWYYIHEYGLGELRKFPTLHVNEHEWLQPASFESRSRHIHEKDRLIIPNLLRQFCRLPKRRWRKFWRGIYRLEWLQGNHFEALRRFNYGSIAPRRLRSARLTPYTCVYCLEEVSLEHYWQHTFGPCQCVRTWWSMLTLPVDVDHYRSLDHFLRALQAEEVRLRLRLTLLRNFDGCYRASHFLCDYSLTT